jgi:hypothetical protein
MDAEEFWGIIGPGDATSCDEVVSAAKGRLEAMTAEEVEGFCWTIHDVLRSMYTWDLWGVAYILKGGCSDDGFEYFRAWLIARGRDFVAQAVADPEGLGVAIDPGPGNYAYGYQCEALLYVGMLTYREKTGALPDISAPLPPEPVGQRWQEEDLAIRFPRLAAGRDV